MQEITISKEFEAFLNDTGLQINHPYKKTVLLEDLFIFPELRTDSDEIISSGELLDIDKTESIITICGDENSGKNTFSYRLLRQIVSLYLNINAVSTTNEENIRELLDIKSKSESGGYLKN